MHSHKLDPSQIRLPETQRIVVPFSLHQLNKHSEGLYRKATQSTDNDFDKAQQFLNAKGIQLPQVPTEMTSYADLTPELNSSTHQSQSIENTLQHTHDVIFLSSIEQTTQTSIRRQLSSTHRTSMNTWKHMKSNLMTQFGKLPVTSQTAGQHPHQRTDDPLKVEMETTLHPGLLQTNSIITPLTTTFYSVVQQHCQARQIFLNRNMSSQLTDPMYQPSSLAAQFTSPLLQQSLKAILSATSFDGISLVKDHLIDIYALLDRMIVNGQEAIAGTQFPSQFIPFHHFHRILGDIDLTPIQVSESYPHSLMTSISDFPHPLFLSPSSLTTVVPSTPLLKSTLSLQFGLLKGTIAYLQESKIRHIQSLLTRQDILARAKLGSSHHFIAKIAAYVRVIHANTTSILDAAKSSVERDMDARRRKEWTSFDDKKERVDFPPEFETFTQDDLPLWPLLFFCIRCGRYLDAIRLLQNPTIASTIDSEKNEKEKSGGLFSVQTIKSFLGFQSKEQIGGTESVHTTDPHSSLFLQLLQDYLMNDHVLSPAANTEFHQHWKANRMHAKSISDSSDLYKIACFQIIGRESTKQTEQVPFHNNNDYLWMLLETVSDEKSVYTEMVASLSNNDPHRAFQSVTLEHAAALIQKRCTERRTPKWKQAFYLLATQQFEMALACLASSDPLSPASIIAGTQSQFSQLTMDEAALLVQLWMCLSHYGLVNEDSAPAKDSNSFVVPVRLDDVKELFNVQTNHNSRTQSVLLFVQPRTLLDSFTRSFLKPFPKVAVSYALVPFSQQTARLAPLSPSTKHLYQQHQFVVNPLVRLIVRLILDSSQIDFFFGSSGTQSSANQNQMITAASDTGPGSLLIVPPNGYLSSFISAESVSFLSYEAGIYAEQNQDIPLAISLLFKSNTEEGLDAACAVSEVAMEPLLLTTPFSLYSEAPFETRKEINARHQEQRQLILKTIVSALIVQQSIHGPLTTVPKLVSLRAIVKVAEAVEAFNAMNFPLSITKIDQSGLIPTTQLQIQSVLSFCSTGIGRCLQNNFAGLFLIYLHSLTQISRSGPNPQQINPYQQMGMVYPTNDTRFDAAKLKERSEVLIEFVNCLGQEGKIKGMDGIQSLTFRLIGNF
ncbi:hypothetical protein BLNAU_11924 [Blattamonas nauphoetae]|uniref:Nuclear pore protein n=1 Tax=Blattamonas nauphoetae TaxID=2049346 RepID=A0ABQ9XL25_9EUKA|nr:hypothetical protein BLNAU_11924 [Blattamonas nauphoetae]